MAQKRFERLFSEGSLETHSIYVDTLTGVNYLFIFNGSSSGLCPLIDKDGKPLVTPVELYED